MKKFIIVFAFFLNLALSGWAQQGPGYANLHILDPYNPDFVPGEVLVKFRDEVPVKVHNLKGILQTGLTSID